MPTERAHALTNTFAIGFLAEVFGTGEALDPVTVALPPDVNFEVRRG